MLNSSSSSTEKSCTESTNGSKQPECATQRIDAVLFDYGQVLSGPPNQAAWARLREVSGLDEERLHASYWKFRHDYDRGALNGKTYWEAVAADAGARFDDGQVAALRAADIELWTDLNKPMVEWAVRLQRAGVRTGLLSNIGDAIGEGVIKKMPWLAGFDACVWSHAMGTAKPDPAIYLKTAAALKTAPRNILFIDDRAENIAAAAELGMQTVHYTSQAAFELTMRARGLAWLLDAGLGKQGTEGCGEVEREPAAK
jgi:putative hydrolase of the HAD superfamily